jgi:hypothetical protein
MVARRALSTAFWSSTRSLEVSFFYRICQCCRVPAQSWDTYLGLLALLEERILTRLVGSLVLGEVTVLAGLLDDLLVYALQVDLGGGGNDISGVYSSKGNTVDFEGTGNKEDTLGEVLEDNDALAAEATSKEDDDGTGLEGLANLRRADRLAGLESQLAELQLTS